GHALPFDERRRARDVAARERASAKRLPFVERAVEREDRRMRSHSENPPLKLVLETVHHGRHDDEYRDGKPDAEHRNEGDERDKALAPPRPQITQRDRKLVRLPQHSPPAFVIRSATPRPARSTPRAERDRASRARSARTRRSESARRRPRAPRTALASRNRRRPGRSGSRTSARATARSRRR